MPRPPPLRPWPATSPPGASPPGASPPPASLAPSTPIDGADGANDTGTIRPGMRRVGVALKPLTAVGLAENTVFAVNGPYVD
jgi:hypothetical protein